MIALENLSKKYDEATVLNVASLTINKGEHFGLVGNNGAGKTTLFSLLLDLIRPSSGKVSINTIDVSKSEAWKKELYLFDFTRKGLAAYTAWPCEWFEKGWCIPVNV